MYTEEMVAKLVELAYLRGKEEAQQEMLETLDRIIGSYRIDSSTRISVGDHTN